MNAVMAVYDGRTTDVNCEGQATSGICIESFAVCDSKCDFPGSTNGPNFKICVRRACSGTSMHMYFFLNF